MDITPVKLIAALMVALSVITTAAIPTSQPNILYILFDDMGYGEPGCYRSDSRLKTPQLDRLAAAGMRFTDAHSASAVCTPTRYGILTGRYPSRIGQYGVLTTFHPPIIPESRLTVASFLKQNGYETACIGKWHLGLTWDDVRESKDRVPIGSKISSGPNQLGFDYFYGFTHARNIGTIIEQDRVVEHVAEAQNQPRMAAKAVEWLENRQSDKPFFLYFPMCPPHTPVAPASDFIGRSGAVDVLKNDPKYGDWVYQGDHMLGQLMDTLEKQGLAENTLVIATADNGAAGREYPPLHKSKGSIYEGGHRVPFVVRWPGKIAAASLSDQTICHNDLIATCAEILGKVLPDNAAEDSISMLPALLGTAKEPLREATIHQSHKGDLAIRQGPWKLIFPLQGPCELYHLGHDIGESRNLARNHPEIVGKLTTLMNHYITAGRSTPGMKQPEEPSARWHAFHKAR